MQLSLGFGLVGIDRFMIMPLFPVMMRDLKFDYQDLGHITAALSVAWGISAMLAGRLSDRFGHRKVIIPAMLAFSLLACARGLAWSVGSLIAIRALMGVAEGAYLHLSLEQMGFVLSAIGVGGTLGGLVMPAWSDRIGRKPVMVLCVVGEFAALCWLSRLGAQPVALFFGLLITIFFVFSMITPTVGPISAEAAPANLMTTASGFVIGVGEVFGGGVAPTLAGYVAKHFGIQYIMQLGLAALVIGLVVALALKETAPARQASGAVPAAS
ncbi:MFS transporter [Paraburkholderia sp. A3BS-1L]|uniref:MFS transporter n=1 Tax=Paraburkholderia sp. A3BS-1L TaxID=3028375 RepID=UPI003DA9EC26